MQRAPARRHPRPLVSPPRPPTVPTRTPPLAAAHKGSVTRASFITTFCAPGPVRATCQPGAHSSAAPAPATPRGPPSHPAHPHVLGGQRNQHGAGAPPDEGGEGAQRARGRPRWEVPPHYCCPYPPPYHTRVCSRRRPRPAPWRRRPGAPAPRPSCSRPSASDVIYMYICKLWLCTGEFHAF
jgi:hypothetical protein